MISNFLFFFFSYRQPTLRTRWKKVKHRNVSTLDRRSRFEPRRMIMTLITLAKPGTRHWSLPSVPVLHSTFYVNISFLSTPLLWNFLSKTIFIGTQQLDTVSTNFWCTPKLSMLTFRCAIPSLLKEYYQVIVVAAAAAVCRCCLLSRRRHWILIPIPTINQLYRMDSTSQVP